MPFTLVFEGDIRDFKSNPFKAETPFGCAYAVAIGDALEEIDRLEQEVDRLKRSGGEA